MRDLERQRVEAADLQRELKLAAGAAAAVAAREQAIGTSSRKRGCRHEEIGYFKVGRLRFAKPRARRLLQGRLPRRRYARIRGHVRYRRARDGHRHMTNEMTSVDMAAAASPSFPMRPGGCGWSWRGSAGTNRAMCARCTAA